MIQELKSTNLNFTSNYPNNMSPSLREYTEKLKAQNNQLQNETKVTEEVPKKSFKEKFAGFLKGFNTTKGVTTGVIGGIVKGGIATVVVGIIGKSIKEAEGNITGTLKNIPGNTKDIVTIAFSKIVKPIAKGVITSIGNTFKSIPGFYSKYLGKSNTKTAIAATLIGIGVMALNIVRNKIKANRQNANIDHSINTGHNQK